MIRDETKRFREETMLNRIKRIMPGGNSRQPDTKKKEVTTYSCFAWSSLAAPAELSYFWKGLHFVFVYTFQFKSLVERNCVTRFL